MNKAPEEWFRQAEYDMSTAAAMHSRAGDISTRSSCVI